MTLRPSTYLSQRNHYVSYHQAPVAPRPILPSGGTSEAGETVRRHDPAMPRADVHNEC
jgi:hypothetical protein